MSEQVGICLDVLLFSIFQSRFYEHDCGFNFIMRTHICRNSSPHAVFVEYFINHV